MISWINYVLTFFNLPPANTLSLHDALVYITSSHSSEVTFEQLSNMSSQVGKWWCYPFAFLSCLMGIALYIRGDSGYRRTYNMKTFKELEHKNWLQITPVLKIDLVKQDIDKGPWAMARLPLDYCKDHNLVRVETVQNKLVWLLNPGPAQRAFVLQLGPLWRGLNSLPVHIQALMVIFLACGLREREVADRFLIQVAGSSGSGKLDFSGVKEQLYKYQNCRILAWVIPRHAYVGTIMATLLEIARSDGVLANAEFLWLKPLDRRLWYILNSVGRQTAVIEVAGLFAHWLAEKKLGCALRVPIVKEAITGLETEIKDTLYIREEDSWRTSSAA